MERIKIVVSNEKSEVIPFGYHENLNASIYDAIKRGDVDLGNKLHASKECKQVTHSELLIADGKQKNKDGLQFSTACIIVSANDPKIIDACVNGLLAEKHISLGAKKLVIDRIESMPKRTFRTEANFVTLSPIVVTTKKEVNGRLVKWDVLALEGGVLNEKFVENVKKNTMKRYRMFCGKEPTSDMFKISQVRDFDNRRITINGVGMKPTFIRCSRMKFKLETSRELLEFVYNAGIGEKNAMGFGCLDIIA
jgi:CRISPR-associated endoribonuclease Cas6